ncbi:hypothetical protein U0070_023524 [Myodes glareolus]|uniref:Uncharacterized protein n=1 Tax=Myodes glareolus TaxID=447135 RepID=A0AAW0HMW6_MYOGA
MSRKRAFPAEVSDVDALPGEWVWPQLGSETWGCLIGCRSSPAKAWCLVTTNQKRGWTLARDGNAEVVRIWRELTLLQLCISWREILAVVTDTPERALKRHSPEECEGAGCSVRPESWSGAQ